MSIRRTVGVWVCLAWLLAGCGGTQKQTTEPDEVVPLDDASAAPGGSATEKPSSPEVADAISAIEAQKFDDAIVLLQSARQKAPKDPQPEYYLGVALSGAGNNAEAVQAFERALVLDPKLVDAYVNLSAAELELNHAEQAEAAAKKGLAVAPKHPDLALNRALALDAMGRTEESLRAYGVAVEFGPQNFTLRVSYAQLLAKAGKKTEALAQVAAVRECGDVRLLAVAANVARQVGAFADCIASLDRAIRIKPHPAIHVRRGMCREDIKDMPGAIEDYTKAVELDPKFAPGQYYLGLTMREKNKTGACEKLLLAARLGGTEGVGPEAAKAASELGCK